MLIVLLLSVVRIILAKLVLKRVHEVASNV